MKLIIALCLVAAVVAAPPPQVRYSNDNVQLVRFDNDNYGTGSYRYAFEQTDGTKREEQGELRNEGTKEEYIAVKGSYTWVSPEGVVYTVTYVADEGGYQPEVEEGPGTSGAVVASLLG